ncbi:MAG: PTS sugar transporter subunit IIA [Brevinema sp.]
MLSFFKKKKVLEICSPCNGEVFPLSETPDVAFAKGMMGEGVCILPQSNTISAPFSCNVDIFHTLHAVGCAVDSIEAIVHIGMNTVELKGQGFNALAPMQGAVEKGTPLIELDLNFLNTHTETLMSPLVIVEKPESAQVEIIRDSGNITVGEPLIRITYY